MMTTGIYRGFSTRAWVEGKNTFRIEDVECVKQDLLNHIYTRFGERVHMPGFGTRIPDLVFEPNDPETIQIIIDDITAVMKSDPRVTLDDIRIYSLPNDYAIVCVVLLTYNEFGVSDELNIDIGGSSKFSTLP
jgi:phage baseplate assembly protein W